MFAAEAGDAPRDFVNQKLFPNLHAFRQKATGPNTAEYKIGEIFGEIKNKIASGYNLGKSSTTSTNSASAPKPKSTSSPISNEAKIRNMGNAGRNPYVIATMNMILQRSRQPTRVPLIQPLSFY